MTTSYRWACLLPGCLQWGCRYVADKIAGAHRQRPVGPPLGIWIPSYAPLTTYSTSLRHFVKRSSVPRIAETRPELSDLHRRWSSQFLLWMLASPYFQLTSSESQSLWHLFVLFSSRGYPHTKLTNLRKAPIQMVILTNARLIIISWRGGLHAAEFSAPL